MCLRPFVRACTHMHAHTHTRTHTHMYREVLFTHFESGEEGTRNVVAECVGKLTLVDPHTLLGKLQVRVCVCVIL